MENDPHSHCREVAPASSLIYTVYSFGSSMFIPFTYFSSLSLKRTRSVSCSDVSDSLRPHRLQPARTLCPWDSPGKNSGVGCHGLLQIFPAQGWNQGLLCCRQILYCLSYRKSKKNLSGCFSHNHVTLFPTIRPLKSSYFASWTRAQLESDTVQCMFQEINGAVMDSGLFQKLVKTQRVINKHHSSCHSSHLWVRISELLASSLA